MKKILAVVFIVLLAFTCMIPAFAASEQADAAVVAVAQEDGDNKFVAFFKDLSAKIKSLFERIKYYFAVKKEKVQNTMNQNAIHMLQSVEDTICDSFIITTEDGKVIAIDGGHTAETEYFIQYLKAVTGQDVPKIDAWFLTHPHNDHVQVFNEVAENQTHRVTFEKVMLNYAPYEHYAALNSEEAADMVGTFDRISKDFPEKVQVLSDGEIFNIGAAKITMLYTCDIAFSNVNDASLIFRMDLGGKSVLFTGDAGVPSGNKVLENPEYKALLDCAICKMSHHGQDGVSKEFYEAVDPDICLWPTPTWVWDNRNGNLQTLEVRAWIEEIGVEKNYLAWEGSQVIYLS